MEANKKIVISLLCIIIFILWFLKSQIEESLYTNSLNLNKINQQIDQYRHENNSLKMELLQKESYTQIAGEAAKMGYTKASTIYLQNGD